MLISINNKNFFTQLLLLLLVVQLSLSAYVQYNHQPNIVKANRDFSVILMETQYETTDWGIDNFSNAVLSPPNSNHPNIFMKGPSSLIKDDLFLELLTPPPENPHYSNSWWNDSNACTWDNTIINPHFSILTFWAFSHINTISYIRQILKTSSLLLVYETNMNFISYKFTQKDN